MAGWSNSVAAVASPIPCLFALNDRAQLCASRLRIAHGDEQWVEWGDLSDEQWFEYVRQNFPSKCQPMRQFLS